MVRAEENVRSFVATLRRRATEGSDLMRAIDGSTLSEEDKSRARVALAEAWKRAIGDLPHDLRIFFFDVLVEARELEDAPPAAREFFESMSAARDEALVRTYVELARRAGVGG